MEHGCDVFGRTSESQSELRPFETRHSTARTWMPLPHDTEHY